MSVDLFTVIAMLFGSGILVTLGKVAVQTGKTLEKITHIEERQIAAEKREDVQDGRIDAIEKKLDKLYTQHRMIHKK